MRKKDLINQNLALFETLQKTQFEVAELKQKLKSSMQQIEELKGKLDENKTPEESPADPMRRLEERVIEAASLKPDVEYGAKIIGEIVVSAAQYSNSLTANGETQHRELVNLILGKTEVAKSEILSVISTVEGIEEKCRRIDEIAANAKEYFESVMAQII